MNIDLDEMPVCATELAEQWEALGDPALGLPDGPALVLSPAAQAELCAALAAQPHTSGWVRDELGRLLVASVAPLVTCVVGQVHRGPGGALVEAEDLFAEAAVLVLSAAVSFDDQRGLSFGSWLAPMLERGLRVVVRGAQQLGTVPRAWHVVAAVAAQLSAEGVPSGELGEAVLGRLTEQQLSRVGADHSDVDACERVRAGLVKSGVVAAVARLPEVLSAVGGELSLDAACSTDTGQTQALMDRVGAQRAGVSAEAEMIARSDAEVLAQGVREVLTVGLDAALGEAVVDLVYARADGAGALGSVVAEVAERHGVCAQALRAAQAEAVERLCSPIAWACLRLDLVDHVDGADPNPSSPGVQPLVPCVAGDDRAGEGGAAQLPADAETLVVWDALRLLGQRAALLAA